MVEIKVNGRSVEDVIDEYDNLVFAAKSLKADCNTVIDAAVSKINAKRIKQSEKQKEVDKVTEDLINSMMKFCEVTFDQKLNPKSAAIVRDIARDMLEDRKQDVTASSLQEILEKFISED